MNKRLRKKKIIEAMYNFSFHDDFVATGFENDGQRRKFTRKSALIYFFGSKKLTENIIRNYYSKIKKTDRILL